jgi:hypothetical protein
LVGDLGQLRQERQHDEEAGEVSDFMLRGVTQPLDQIGATGLCRGQHVPTRSGVRVRSPL